ncbi:MAG TPA: hypothetical protein VI756_18845, partial [Blastocatellia bacterium]
MKALCFAPLVLLLVPVITNAQSPYEYLGPGRSVPDRTSPTLGIKFNDRGFEYVSQKRLNESQTLLVSLGARKSQIKELAGFPHQNYGDWVEQSYHTALSQFTACGGAISARAQTFDPAQVYVSFEPTIFTDETYFPGQ